ncbi:MAG TPA: CoA pyrophosphatase [Gammaproteobacteria bacterium]|nr:CoA pyrophosphatase [Gammaproteobacteria bacterium]
MEFKGGKFHESLRRHFASTEAPHDFSLHRARGDLPPELLPSPPWKPASVLLPVVARPEGATLLFTRRTERLHDHAGQVSFPGGGREASDRDAVDTALRETEEEIGLRRRQVEVLGFLEGYLTVSGYAVTPVVGLVAPGFDLTPDPLEVAEVFEAPLAFLADPGNREVREREYAGRMLGYYLFKYGEQVIWGATAAMLVTFLDCLKVERS